MTTPGIDRLKEAELTGLRWSRNCNAAAGVGYLGPTVKRHGPLVEYKGLVAAGLLRVVRDRRRPHQDNGYWITPAGLAKLSEVERAAIMVPDNAPESLPVDAQDRAPTEEDLAETLATMDERGKVTWCSSEEDGGPDCGMSVGLGGGRMLYVGEMPTSTLEEHGVTDGESSSGWWLVLYERHDTRIIGPVIATDEARNLIETLAAALVMGPLEGVHDDNQPNENRPNQTSIPEQLGRTNG